MSEIARGSNGGAARAAKLSPEQRSAIAKAAAAKRWGKTKEKVPLVDPEIKKSIDRISEGIENSIDDVLRENGLHKDYPSLISGPTMNVPFIYKEETKPTPEPLPSSPPAPRKPRPKPVPKAFKGASSYAEKRLAEAIRERSEYMGRVAALNAEIPSLVQVIRALGSSAIPTEAMQAYPPAYPMQSFNTPMQDFTDPARMNQPYYPTPAIEQNPIDPALYRTNSNPLPGLVPAAQNAPMVPNMSVGGAMDLDYSPVEEEGPKLANMGGGWV
jgi:hypothetical protein